MIGGIVLAAGASKRAGTIKALAEIDGQSFVARVVHMLREGGCDDVVVVVGSPHAESVVRAIGDTRHVMNREPERGMLSSLRCGLRDDWDAAIVALVDHPRVASSTVRALIDAWAARGAEVVRPVHEGQSGHPYLVSREVFGALRSGDGVGGARPILAVRRREDVEIDDAFVHDDIDTADELAAVRDD